MREKETNRWWWVGLFIVAALAVGIGYFAGLKMGKGPQETPGGPPAQEGPALTSPAPENLPKEEDSSVQQQVQQPLPHPSEEKIDPFAMDCAQVQEEVEGFFTYLDQKKYPQTFKLGTNSFERFQEIIQALSNNPPVPAGEGVDTRLITKNIFHFFRILDRRDFRLIKEILKNESDSLEPNLAIFYLWLTGKGKNPCPPLNHREPSLEVLYRYAGFFLNTIGGRAYLFRRSTKLRLLLSFYSLLILYEADQQGKNTYGIDPLPLVESVTEEISLYPDLLYKEAYLEKLEEIARTYSYRR